MKLEHNFKIAGYFWRDSPTYFSVSGWVETNLQWSQKSLFFKVSVNCSTIYNQVGGRRHDSAMLAMSSLLVELQAFPIGPN